MIAEAARRFHIREDVRTAAEDAWDRARTLRYEAQTENKMRVIDAFMQQGIIESDLPGTTGYGYDDAAREHYEALLCNLFGAQSTIARLNVVSGTHAIVTAIAACAPSGRTLLSITGRPYDTLYNAIALAPYSRMQCGMGYAQIDLRDGLFDVEATANALRDERISAVFVQRSRGYAVRPSLNVTACEETFAAIRAQRPDVAILVDNCYGELVETREPLHAGADLIMGSLIKNIGGTIAPAGAYIAGTADCMERVAAKLLAPGLSALGPTLGAGRQLLQGLFLAPMIIEETLRGLDFAAALFAALGFEVDPQCGAPRADTVQAIRLGNERLLNAFAQGLQRAMPVNARFRPLAGAVPGYAEPVLMSGGAFISGATSELSCDAPLRLPFEVYLQGGAMAEHTIVATMLAAQSVLAARS
ncbi:MAG: aluminum resistance family protein [Candidatus Meridianibacter frigidus]|nr:MAG: aluminum resistance family protein [Candidatus Eremiobacteraeota bacterium]